MSLVDWVRLSLSLTPGSMLTEKIFSVYKDPSDFFADDYETAEEKVKPFSLKNDFHDAGEEAAEKVIEQIDYTGIDIITRESEEFPESLLKIKNPPILLYVMGDITCLQEAPAIGMIGTRSLSDYGKSAAKLISSQLTKAGAVIVSGMAKGADTESHIACLSSGGKTVAVLGCGIFHTYPPENAELKEAIARSGAVVSEFAPNASPSSDKFLTRNRIVSGLSLGVCVVEAAYRSGTSVTARLAAEQGRKVFAVPGNIFSKNNQGIMRLLRNGATAVSSGADILAEFADEFPEEYEAAKLLQRSSPTYDGEDTAPAIKKDYVPRSRPSASSAPSAPVQTTLKVKPPVPKGISADAAAVYEKMELLKPDDPASLSDKTGLALPKVITALTELELSGAVVPSPGGRFIIEI